MQIRSRRLQALLDRLPQAWTVIARRSRTPALHEDVGWRPIYSYLTDLEAKQLQQAGAILMATRHAENQVELVVRPRRSQG